VYRFERINQHIHKGGYTQCFLYSDWYYQTLYDPETRKLTGAQKHYTKEQIAKYIEGKSHDTSSVLLAIATRDSDTLRV
jgi:hypothetical protein